MPQVSWGEGVKAFLVVKNEQWNGLNTECEYGADYKSSASNSCELSAIRAKAMTKIAPEGLGSCYRRRKA